MIDSNQTIDDISSLVDISFPYGTVFLIALGVIAVFIGLFFLYRFIKRKIKKKLTPYQKLKFILEAYNPHNQKIDSKLFSFEISLGLRTYLSFIWKFSFLELTTQEFLKKIQKMHPKHFDFFEKFCHKTDLSKYSKKDISQEEILPFWEQTQTYTQQLEQEYQEQQKKKKK